MNSLNTTIQQGTPTPAHQDLWRRFTLGTMLLGALHVLIIGALLFFFRPGSEPVVLRYNVYFGIDTLAAWWQIHLLPLLSALFVSGNILLARRYLREGLIIPAILLFLGSGIIVVGLVIAVMAITFINY